LKLNETGNVVQKRSSIGRIQLQTMLPVVKVVWLVCFPTAHDLNNRKQRQFLHKNSYGASLLTSLFVVQKPKYPSHPRSVPEVQNGFGVILLSVEQVLLNC
jgi:hypothetical protein